MCLRISLETKFATCAKGPELQGPLAENAPVITYPRAENVADLITADHNIFNEECESRNSHRYAVIVQDLATR